MNADCEPSRAESVSGLERSRLPSAIIIVFLLTCMLALANRLGAQVAPNWLNAMVVGIGFAAAVASVAPVLPWSNALVAAGMAVGAGGLAEAASAAVGFPFASREFKPVNGPMVFGLVPWWLPMAWGILALSARGTARLVLYRTREHHLNGYRVIGLAAALAGGASLSLEIFATRSAQLWERGGMSAGSHATLLLLHLLIQIGLTPMLIDKFPGRRPANFLPLWVWGAAVLILGSGILEAAVIR